MMGSVKRFYFCKSDVSTFYYSVIVTFVISCTIMEILQFFVLVTTPLFHPNFFGGGVFPLHQIAHVGVNVSRCLKLFGREIIFEVFQSM